MARSAARNEIHGRARNRMVQELGTVIETPREAHLYWAGYDENRSR